MTSSKRKSIAPVRGSMLEDRRLSYRLLPQALMGKFGSSGVSSPCLWYGPGLVHFLLPQEKRRRCTNRSITEGGRV